MSDIVDLFCGAGGWAHGLDLLGVERNDVVGVEMWEPAAATHAKTGFPTINMSVLDLDPKEFIRATGLIASPPCQGFSIAGKKKGFYKRKLFMDHLDKCADGWVAPEGLICEDDIRADLTLEPLRWVDAIRPRWIAMEQSTAVEPLWRYIGNVLQKWGYKTWTGVVSADSYGVPQARKRAILLGSLDRRPVEPLPTHDAYESAGQEGDTLFGSSLPRFVSMADALGWGMPDRPSYTVCGDLAAKEFGIGWGGSFVRDALQQRKNSKNPHIWTPKPGDEGSMSVTMADLEKLQTFPADIPWQGLQRERLKQVSNAVPPLMASAILREVIRHKEAK